MSLRFISSRFRILTSEVSLHLHNSIVLWIACRLPIAMASLIDSSAQFDQRCSEIGLSRGAIDRLHRAGITSLGVLAYSHGQPGQASSDASFNIWVRDNIDNGVSLGDLSMIKRLLFEAHMLALASLKEQITTPDTVANRKVPASERESKMANIKTTLVGFNLEGANEPGHTLLDSYSQMFHLNEIRFVPPEKCVSRLHEVTHAKQPTKQLELEADHLIIKEKQEIPSETASSALQVKEALGRSGIGLVFAELVSHSAYTKYLGALFAHLHREPPPGYSRCSVSQLVAAEKAVWSRLLEEGIRPKRAPDGSLPLWFVHWSHIRFRLHCCRCLRRRNQHLRQTPQSRSRVNSGINSLRGRVMENRASLVQRVKNCHIKSWSLETLKRRQTKKKLTLKIAQTERTVRVVPRGNMCVPNALARILSVSMESIDVLGQLTIVRLRMMAVIHLRCKPKFCHSSCFE